RGKERMGRVIKTRCEGFPEGELFPFSYEEIAKRYGREILERNAQVETLASAEQVDEIKRLINILKITAEVTDKWLDKAKAETFAELPTDAADKCIAYMTDLVNKKPQVAA
ncbi:MAG TPA: hypothetical protein VHI52_21810, partial [Verrucomicrobiae bacterium]|nr:hypothetical protein [Verrucomicrobiae bacterium]